MEKNEHDKISTFDTLFATNHTQMMKIVMPYLEQEQQKQIAVFIKYLEFQYTLSYFNSSPSELYSCSNHSIPKEEFNVNKICSEVLPYCTNEEKKKMEQITGLFRTMEMYREMSQTFEIMKDLFPENFSDFSGTSQRSSFDNSSGNPMDNPLFSMLGSMMSGTSGSSSGGNMTDMLMNMLTPEQKTMFEMFGGNNNNESK